MKGSLKHTGMVATVLAALTLSACGGGATVENDDVSSVAPTTRSSESPEASESETESESTSSSTTESSRQAPGGAAPAEPQPEDGAAKEIDEIPEQTPQRSPEEEALLEEIGEGGIDVAGVEEQLIGAANTVCDAAAQDSESVILPAVAGQLIEQGKTDLSHEEATSLIDSVARSAYC